MSNFETLLKCMDLKYNDRWHPIIIDTFEKVLSDGKYNGMSKELRKNIVYTLQYLQYLQIQFEDIKLHSVIEKHLVKTYMINSCGIIEGVFHHLLKSHNFYNKEEWETRDKPVHTNPFMKNGEEQKHVITTYYKLRTPKNGEMDFAAIIQKIKDKSLLSLNGKDYLILGILRNKRNKIHLQKTDKINDTDFLCLDKDDYLLTRYILHKILTNNKLDITVDSTCLDFISLSSDELNILKQRKGDLL